MSDIPSIDITALHAAIKTALVAQFPSYTVDYYVRPSTPALPALYFELESIEPTNAPDMGTEQLEADLRFSVEIITTYKAGGLLEARVIAAAVAAFVQRQRWGQPVTPAKVTSSGPEHFHTENPSFEAWSVKWIQSGALGVDAWTQSGATIAEGYSAQDGKVTLGDAPEYLQLYPSFSDPLEPDRTDITLS